jgi:long-chain acyl-CoA synthetase
MTGTVFNETTGLLNKLFDKIASSRADAIALIHEDRHISFFELQLYVEWMSGYFQSISLQPGQRVALLLPNSPKFPISFFGLMRAGGVAVPLDISSDEHELRSRLMLSKATALITTPECKTLLDKALAESSGNGVALPRMIVAVFEEDNIVTLNKTARECRTSSANGKTAALNQKTDDLTRNRQVNSCAHVEMTDAVTDYPAVIQFKEAQFCVRTHDDLMREAEAMIAQTQLTADDRLVCLAPFCQTNYLSNCLIAAITAGATMVLLEPSNWENISQVLGNEHVTMIAGPAALLRHLTESKTAAISSLRWYFCTDSLSPKMSESLQQKTGFNVGLLPDTINSGISYHL